MEVLTGGLSTTDSAEEMTLLMSVGSASTPDFTEDTTLEIMLLMSEGSASTSDFTDEMTLLTADGTWSISDFAEETMLLMADVASSMSEMIDEMGRISGKEGAAVLSGAPLLLLEAEVTMASKLVVVGSAA